MEKYELMSRPPNPPLHKSIAELTESELVQQLVADPHWRASLFGIVGMPDNPRVLQEVPLQHAPGDHLGDVDILLCAPDHPSVATAIEVKRIKIKPSTFHSGKPNKLHEYDKAVGQAKRLAKVGFSQVYLYVFVVVDSREKNDGRYTYDGLTPELRSVVQTRISLRPPPPPIGLVIHEFVQSMDHPPLTLGAAGGHLERLADPVPQPAALTEWLAGLL